MRPLSETSRILFFVAVGGVATLVHWVVAVCATEVMSDRPLLANAIGWIAAVSASFLGHFAFTFRGHGQPFVTAAFRFVAVSAVGFASNTMLYSLLLWLDPALFRLWLAVALAVAAGLTYHLSRVWTFAARSDAA